MPGTVTDEQCRKYAFTVGCMQCPYNIGGHCDRKMTRKEHERIQAEREKWHETLSHEEMEINRREYGNFRKKRHTKTTE